MRLPPATPPNPDGPVVGRVAAARIQAGRAAVSRAIRRPSANRLEGTNGANGDHGWTANGKSVNEEVGNRSNGHAHDDFLRDAPPQAGRMVMQTDRATPEPEDRPSPTAEATRPTAPSPDPSTDDEVPRHRQVSLRDVAKTAGVSVATVSLVLNNSGRISRGTKQRVRQVMEELGYQPNRLAQSLSGKHTNVIAVMMPALRHAFADAYFGELISGIIDKAHQLGNKVLLEQAKPEYLADKKHVELFERRYVDGVLLLGTSDYHEYAGDFSAAGCPMLVVDNWIDKFKTECVVCDYAQGADQVMNYLLQLGHRKIGLLAAAPEIATSRVVRQVYDEKLAGAGVESDPTLVHDGQFTEQGGATATRDLISLHPDVTAILATNDKMAIGAMHWLQRCGYQVPRDISVVGFDDLKQSAFVNPSLTTIHLPLYQVGSTACARLIERVRGQRQPVCETLATHLVVRNSTAMARHHELPEPRHAVADFESYD